MVIVDAANTSASTAFADQITMKLCFDAAIAIAIAIDTTTAITIAPSFAMSHPILQTNPTFCLIMSPLQTKVFFKRNGQNWTLVSLLPHG